MLLVVSIVVVLVMYRCVKKSQLVPFCILLTSALIICGSYCRMLGLIERSKSADNDIEACSIMITHYQQQGNDKKVLEYQQELHIPMKLKM